MIRIAISLLLVFAYLFLPIPELNAFNYQFYHANVFHLAVNIIATWTLFQPFKDKQNVVCLIMSYIISVCVFPCSNSTAIGISNLLYASIGLRTPDFKNPWWTQLPVITFHVITLLMLFVPQVAGLTHIIAYVSAVLLNDFIRRINRTLFPKA